MSRFFSYCVFFISYTPLWISILFVDITSIFEKNVCLFSEYFSILCISSIFLFSIIVVTYDLYRRKNIATQFVNLTSAIEVKTITAEYLISFVLPLFTFEFTHWKGIVLFLIYYFTLEYICIRHNYFCINIVLELMKFRIYTCELLTEDDIYITKNIISKRTLTQNIGNDIYIRSINNEYKIDVIK